jgi:hypothetical protein
MVSEQVVDIRAPDQDKDRPASKLTDTPNQAIFAIIARMHDNGSEL